MQAVLDQAALMSRDRTDAHVEGAGASRADRAMERYACGDDSAFAELYDELAPRLYRFARRWTRSRSAADDTVQQTLLQMHAARDRFVPGGAVLPWAYAIARRLLIDLGRRGLREELRAVDARDPEEPAPTLAADEALHRRRMEAEARRDLAALPDGWREAFELVKFEGLSVADAAEVLGITRGMVKIRAHRATVALRAATARRLRDAPERPARPDLRVVRPGDVSEGGMST
jgi:RNA polymerase sigma-70 factor (ECF subfamily)